MRRQLLAGRPQQVELPLGPAPIVKDGGHETAKLLSRSESELRAALADLLLAAVGGGSKITVAGGGGEENDQREDHC